MDVLTINGYDYGRYVEKKGVGWSRNDIDSTTTTRLKNGDMRRKKLTTKRKLQYTLLPMPGELLAQLDTALSADTFTATYIDAHGVQTRTFYCSSMTAALESVVDNEPRWINIAFSIIEV